jgi:membrane-bound lytic murein transglycosylase D
MTARIANMANQLQPALPRPDQAAAPAPKTTPTPIADKKEAKVKIHTVQKGETLYRISRQYKLSVEQLRQYNKLDANASIYPGQKLNVSPPQ